METTSRINSSPGGRSTSIDGLTPPSPSQDFWIEAVHRILPPRDFISLREALKTTNVAFFAVALSNFFSLASSCGEKQALELAQALKTETLDSFQSFFGPREILFVHWNSVNEILVAFPFNQACVARLMENKPAFRLHLQNNPNLQAMLPTGR